MEKLNWFHCILPGSTGTLSLSGSPSMMIREEIVKNPQMLKATKAEVLGILDQELERRGIPKVNLVLHETEECLLL